LLGDFRFWQILLQKSFLGDERNFLGPLMRFVCIGTQRTSSDVRLMSAFRGKAEVAIASPDFR
jgi:hypothetical protein